MDPDARQFVILQLLVIVVPVGTLFALWIAMLGRRLRRPQTQQSHLAAFLQTLSHLQGCNNQQCDGASADKP